MSAVHGQDRKGAAYGNWANEEAPRCEEEMLGRGMLLGICVSYGLLLHCSSSLYQLLLAQGLALDLDWLVAVSPQGFRGLTQFASKSHTTLHTKH